MKMFCILLVVLSIATHIMSQSTTVEVSLGQYSVVGGITDATCTFSTIVAGQTVSAVSWRHNVTRALVDGGRISITTDIAGGESRLEIEGVVHSDAGEYTCRVEFENPSVLDTESALLQVASLEVEAEAEQTVVEGGNITLICNVSGSPAPRIKWHRVKEDSEILLKSDNFEFGTYVINNVGQDQAGTYRCTGQYTFGSEHVDIELVVFTVPVITTAAQHVTVLYTDSLHLTCSATGVKDPAYRWLLNEEELMDGDNVELNSETGNLTIDGLSYDYTGNYTCVAMTGAGTDNLTHTVTVSAAPEITLLGDQTELIVAVNSVVEIECPFRSHPLPEVKWYKQKQNGKREEINSLAEGFTIFQFNGSLLIENVSQDQASQYDCNLSNMFGSDNRTFFLRVVVQPNSPEEFRIFERGDRSVGVMWQAPPISPIQPVDEYVLQLSYEERGTITSTVTIPSNQTSYVANDLVPGVSYSLVLSSSNMAGLSPPTQTLTHNTIIARPRLEFFTARSLGDGRSVLLQWRLEYSGGREIDTFQIKVLIEGVQVDVLEPDVYSETLLLDDLRPTTDYQFVAVVGSSVGTADPILANASTPLAAPSKPSRPDLQLSSPQTITFSFSVKFGSYPIKYYLLRVYDAGDPIDTNDTNDTTNMTLTEDDLGYRLVNITSGDGDYVTSEEEMVDGGEVVGYDVTMRVGGLEQRRSYVFIVAAASIIGVGDYSDPSDSFSLEDSGILFLIVGGVVGGCVLLVVMLCSTFIVCYLLRRSHRGAITRRGSDSTGVATDYNLRFEPFPCTTTSPILSQRVDSTSPLPQLSSPHYYNSLKKYRSDTLPLNGDMTDNAKVNGKSSEVQVHSNRVSEKWDSGIELVDSGYYSRPTKHSSQPPPTHPISPQPPTFIPPPAHPSSTLPSLLPQSSITSSTAPNPTYGYPSSHPLYSTPKKGNKAQVSTSGGPTMEDVVVSSGSKTLPLGATTAGYIQGQREEGDVDEALPLEESGRRYHSMTLQTTLYDSDTIVASDRAGFQTDV